MALLLVSRGSFTGCSLIAHHLSETHGWRCLTREDLLATVDAHGGIATRITASLDSAIEDYGKFSELRRPYKILMQLALLGHVRQGDVAYFGCAGHLLLPRIPHAVRAHVVAPVERRVSLLRERETLSEEAARRRIREVDEERNRWTRFMYGKNLPDPVLFDLSINLERVSSRSASSMLLNATQQEEFQPTTESRAAVENRYLCARVLAALFEDSRTSEIEIDATADKGHVVLSGPYLDDPERAGVVETARGVDGVAGVDYTEGYSPPFDVFI